MKTVRCLYDALHDPLSLTILSGNGALGSFFKVSTDKYFQMETLDPEEDPLTWWRDTQMMFPHLSKLARKYLCIPATSSSSERVFSTSGNIVSCLHSTLKPDHVNRLVFLAKKTLSMCHFHLK